MVRKDCMMMRAYERFLKYVTVYTTSDPASASHPTTQRQFDLARLLVEQLKELGVSQVELDEKCYVYAKIPATPGFEGKTALGFVAHMDTAPAAPGKNVWIRSGAVFNSCLIKISGVCTALSKISRKSAGT